MKDYNAGNTLYRQKIKVDPASLLCRTEQRSRSSRHSMPCSSLNWLSSPLSISCARWSTAQHRGHYIISSTYATSLHQPGSRLSRHSTAYARTNCPVSTALFVDLTACGVKYRVIYPDPASGVVANVTGKETLVVAGTPPSFALLSSLPGSCSLNASVLGCQWACVVPQAPTHTPAPLSLPWLEPGYPASDLRFADFMAHFPDSPRRPSFSPRFHLPRPERRSGGYTWKTPDRPPETYFCAVLFIAFFQLSCRVQVLTYTHLKFDRQFPRIVPGKPRSGLNPKPGASPVGLVKRGLISASASPGTGQRTPRPPALARPSWRPASPDLERVPHPIGGPSLILSGEVRCATHWTHAIPPGLLALLRDSDESPARYLAIPPWQHPPSKGRLQTSIRSAR
ncbi:hypothetical protein N658DRAFT_494390 [Parathielavia hyrcaniae]|uniref:Uncharacterized protein n=1 Tax=Parathielavia hyrcaniae TaxID=113614 RepID=A0AAN6Q3X1_9PEZI|nr:hypothetical protein N658DRAFT_494390 [Parathielavia hyrcaniae]